MAAGAVAVGALGSPMAGALAAVPVGLYWWVGLRDLEQEAHTLKRNFPVLGNLRWQVMGCMKVVVVAPIAVQLELLPACPRCQYTL